MCVCACVGVGAHLCVVYVEARSQHQMFNISVPREMSKFLFLTYLIFLKRFLKMNMQGIRYHYDISEQSVF